ncbi:MAG: pseudaminic acid cytidylyltransferase [Chitinophagaceae bacterium]|nr:pseudaminic acid cytidylyltransferase [Chitinophagaceae bacterium]MCW5905662.1 pseudaminic acid cytidylyltransferase [Chitinophagaceae bacterium]
MSLFNNIAIIPARGGSKRIPRKNIKEFLGKPIIAYSIQTAIQSNLFNEIMVSTDDEEIATIAKQYGAKVPSMRSSKNADDYATTIDVLNEVLNFYKNDNKHFDYACCIYPTAPLVNVAQLNNGFEKLHTNKADAVFPIVAFSYPIWRSVEVDENGYTKMLWNEYLKSRSQDLKKVYHDAGQWYWFNPNKITNSLFTDNTTSIILKEDEVQDIDTPTDWLLAEMKYKILYHQ